MNKIKIYLSVLFAIFYLSANSQNFFWSHSKPVFKIKYGLLYNWYAAIDSRKISSSDDWNVITEAQWQSLKTYLGNNSGKLKETGLIYWDSPNTGATNDYGLGTRGYGARNNIGGFGFIKREAGTWGLFSSPSTGGIYELGSYNTTSMARTIVSSNYGYPVMLVKTATGISDGSTTTYTGNDLRTYTAVAINQLYHVVGLCETKFRNGDTIPYHGIDNTSNFTNAEWAALTTAGCCAYNNDLSNVGTGFAFP